MTKEEIEEEFNAFFEFPTDKKDHVTSTSAKLFAQHIADKSIAAEREAYAMVCDGIGDMHWKAYKYGNSPGRADPHYQGLSMGAEECAEAIRERAEDKENSDCGCSAVNET